MLKLNDKAEVTLAGAGVIGILITVLVAALIFQIAPVIGGKVENSLPSDLGATSGWNSSYNTDLPEGSSVWEDNATMVSVLILIIIVSAMIGYLVRMYM